MWTFHQKSRTLIRQSLNKITKRRCTTNPNANASTAPTTTTTVEAKKETMVEKWVTYWKGVHRDYTTVAKDVIEECKNRPFKALTYLTAFTAGTYCSIHNPDETSFTDQLLGYSAELGMVSPSMQNQKSASHILFLRNERNERRLKRFSFLIFSVMYLDDNSEKCNTYESACKYLDTPMQKYIDKVVDIGFLDRWWILDRNMENYDINDDE